MMMISSVLDKNEQIYKLVQEDLIAGLKKPGAGRKGMSGEQVVRTALIKMIHGFDYRELEFHLEDSNIFRMFSRLGFDKKISKSVLQANIKRIKPESWEKINCIILNYSNEKGIEKGRKVRGDCTVVETNIHEPSDCYST